MIAGKGANTVISLLHHYHQHYSFGEQKLHLHADNCSGQNKNNAMIEVKPRLLLGNKMHVYSLLYLMWRVLTGLQKEIIMSFMMVGHTKFAPDCCFAVLKRKFRRERVNCLDDQTVLLLSNNDSCLVF